MVVRVGVAGRKDVGVFRVAVVVVVVVEIQGVQVRGQVAWRGDVGLGEEGGGCLAAAAVADGGVDLILGGGGGDARVLFVRACVVESVEAAWVF